MPLIVEEFADGFITRAATTPSDDLHPVLIVDRHTGALSRWPALPHDLLVREYADYRTAH